MYEENVPSIYEYPYTKNVLFDVNQPQQLSDLHSHKEYEFLVVSSGMLRCLTINNEFIAKKGDILFINSNVVHGTYDLVGNTSHSVTQFSSPTIVDTPLQYIHRFSNRHNSDVYLFKNSLPQTEEIRQCINLIFKETNSNLPYRREHIQSYILLTIAKMKRFGVISEFNYSTCNFEKIKPAIEFINDNFNNNISTKQLAELLNFNETYFCRLFKNIIGTTPLNYLNFVRICKSEYMLKKGKPISEVAYATGFSSLSYFTRTFKKYNACSPLEYKKIIKK